MTKKWEPKDFERYFVVSGDLKILKWTWDDDKSDNSYCNVGNCFRTKALAQSALKQIQKVLKEAKHS